MTKNWLSSVTLAQGDDGLHAVYPGRDRTGGLLQKWEVADRSFINPKMIISNEWLMLKQRTGISFTANLMQCLDFGQHCKDRITGWIIFACCFISIYIWLSKWKPRLEQGSHYPCTEGFWPRFKRRGMSTFILAKFQTCNYFLPT